MMSESYPQNEPSVSISRRRFMASSAATAFSFNILSSTLHGQGAKQSPNNKLNIAVVGAGGMGSGNLNNCASENIVALCDVDEVRAADSFNKYPRAQKYKDFRRMLEKEDKNIDAVVVATPDHTHAVIGMMALKMKKHLFIQKPLAHTIYEVQQLTKAACAAGVQTQMGNQGHSSNAIRDLKEWIADDAVGKVREVHAWSDRPVGGRPWSDFAVCARPTDTPPIPKTLDWDLWLGPVPRRPYHPEYVPLKW
ncbi:Gfo/Idh/MocA family oxidoreductase, partial [Planctomycetota bacterium]